MIRALAAALPLAVLGGCASAVPVPRGSPPPVTAAPPPTVVKPVQNNSLIGQSADAAQRMFGKPRLDVTEGAARKLQFEGSACVIDIYYYAPRAGAPPVATHVDARTPDGRSAELNSCVETLRR
jgi:hypothetical protein